MTFENLKKKFVKALKKPDAQPTSGFLEMGEFDRHKDRYECEGDFNILVDPEGDAWIFLGKHETVAKQVAQKPSPEN